jgi:hypothetical protein
MNKENESRTGLDNTDVVIAKCTNRDCGWEVQAKEELVANGAGDISCPMCAKPMAWEVN